MQGAWREPRLPRGFLFLLLDISNVAPLLSLSLSFGVVACPHKLACELVNGEKRISGHRTDILFWIWLHRYAVGTFSIDVQSVYW